MPEIYQRDADINNEILVAKLVNGFLKEKQPQYTYRFIPSNYSLYARSFRVTHPRHYNKNGKGEIMPDPHDFDIWRDHLHIGVLEVKYRKARASWLHSEGPLMGSRKIRNLEYYFLRRGFQVWFAWFGATDGGLILSEHSRWVKHGGRGSIGDYEITCKDDHGTKTKNYDPRDFIFPTEACTLIPNAVQLYG